MIASHFFFSLCRRTFKSEFLLNIWRLWFLFPYSCFLPQVQAEHPVKDRRSTCSCGTLQGRRGSWTSFHTRILKNFLNPPYRLWIIPILFQIPKFDDGFFSRCYGFPPPVWSDKRTKLPQCPKLDEYVWRCPNSELKIVSWAAALLLISPSCPSCLCSETET